MQWTGANLAGFDYGNLARAGGVWCTDDACSSGGWSDPRVPEDENCPGYGGDGSPTYAPALVCNNITVPAKYNGGFGAPKDFEGINFGSGGAAAAVAIPSYARASPLLDEARGAFAFGINSFRVPFRVEMVHELWADTWLTDSSHPEYLPPYPQYLQMVVDYVEAVLALPGARSDGKTPAPSIVFEMHNYMRWCPLGIGGTFSCLEETGYDGPIRYSTDAKTTSCPLSSVFPSHASFDSVCPSKQTPAQAAGYWDQPSTAVNFTGTPDYGMGSGWSCPLDEGTTPPPQSRRETCGVNAHSTPTKEGAENPYAKILTSKCWVRIWQRLLEVSVSSRAFPGQCVPLHRVLGHYADEAKPVR